MEYRNLRVEKRGRVGLITLDRPQALNALCDALVVELGHALDDLEGDPAIGCLVITGSEKAFAAGADIKEMQGRDFIDVYGADFITRGWERVAQCRKPVIAAVAGYALGTLPGAGGSQRLTRAVGKAKAMEMCLTGRLMDAVEAERAGLVARIVPAASLLDEAIKLAGRIAGQSLPGAMMVKESINR